MVNRRIAVGIALTCALVFGAGSASNAFALKGTTAYFCSPVSPGTGGFTDAHCDSEGTGSFAHVQFPAEGVKVELTNEKTKNSTTESTPMVIRSLAANVEVSCATVSGSTTLTNTEAGGKMEVAGSSVVVQLTNCTVLKPANKHCKIKEAKGFIGITSTSRTEISYVNSSGETINNTMDTEFKNASNEIFLIEMEGNECPFTGTPIKILGTVIGTGARGSTEAVSSSGATLSFNNEMTEKTLNFGTFKVGVSGTLTLRTSDGEGITMTTTS